MHSGIGVEVHCISLCSNNGLSNIRVSRRLGSCRTNRPSEFLTGRLCCRNFCQMLLYFGSGSIHFVGMLRFSILESLAVSAKYELDAIPDDADSFRESACLLCLMTSSIECFLEPSTYESTSEMGDTSKL